MEATVKANAPLNTEKAKALQAALLQIEKQFCKGTIMKLGAGEVIEDDGESFNKIVDFLDDLKVI